MKIVFIVIDGLGDEPIPQLKNKTPLEAAKTPYLDFLAQNGICGLVEPYQTNKNEPTSEDTHLALFGYNPKTSNPGRGVLEAMGIGMEISSTDVCLRGNFATINKNLKIIDRRVGRISETEPLIKSLNGIKIEGVKFILKKSFGHRAVLVLRGKNLSEKIGDGDPKKIGERVKKIIPLDSKAKYTADVLNRFLIISHRLLKIHPLNEKREKKGLFPANYLLVRGAGVFKKTPSFKEKYGLKSSCIAGGALYKGIAKILGMDLITVKGATGFSNTNLKGKFLAAKNALKKYNFIFCHIKAADNLAEDGNFIGKKEFIEKIDENLKTLLNLKNTLIIITADHSTCSILKRHCLKPIPILIFGDGKDSVKKFSEKECKMGKLGKINQLELMPKILKLVKR